MYVQVPGREPGARGSKVSCFAVSSFHRFSPTQQALRGVGGIEAPLELRRRHVVCAQGLQNPTGKKTI